MSYEMYVQTRFLSNVLFRYIPLKSLQLEKFRETTQMFIDSELAEIYKLRSLQNLNN